MRAPGNAGGHAVPGLSARSLLSMVVVTFVWGCNWPILKIGVAALAPLTFRAVTLPFAAIGLLATAAIAGESIRIPRACWGKLLLLAFFNITLWNGLVLFGVAQLPAGRSAIIAYTMPVWSVLFSLPLLHEPLSARRVAGLVLGMLAMAVLLGDDILNFQRAPTAALLILGAAMSWALGIVLLRKWRLPLSQTVVSGWMMLTGVVPIAVMAPFFAPGPVQSLSPIAWFAIFYNVVFAGALAHWAFFNLARTLPVAVSSMSSLPVPIVGVFAGMLLLGERPGPSDWAAFALVIAAMVAVLWPSGRASAPAVPEP